MRQLCAFHVNLRFHNNEAKFSSSLFAAHCIDAILQIIQDINDERPLEIQDRTITNSGINTESMTFKENSLLTKSMEFQDLGNIYIVFSNCIETLFSIILSVIKSEQYKKLRNISDVYFRLVST